MALSNPIPRVGTLIEPPLERTEMTCRRVARYASPKKKGDEKAEFGVVSMGTL